MNSSELNDSEGTIAAQLVDSLITIFSDSILLSVEMISKLDNVSMELSGFCGAYLVNNYLNFNANPHQIEKLIYYFLVIFNDKNRS